MKRKKVIADIASTSHDEHVRECLRNQPDFAREYLNAAMEDTEEPQVLRIALRRIVDANGGITAFAKTAGVTRASLYRALTPKGIPRLSTLLVVAKAAGLKLTVE